MDSEPLSRQLEATLQRFAAMVRAVGRRNGLDPSELEELLQAIRLRLWRALGDRESIARISSSYMYQTAMSAAIDLIRARRAHRAAPGDPSVILEAAAQPGGLAADLEAREAATRILELLDGLAVDRRAATKLYLAGYSGEEIAIMLQWSRTRTRNLLYRGLADLRQRMVELGMAPDGRQQ